MENGSDKKKTQVKRNTLFSSAKTYYDKSEIRCPECGKLLAKGSFREGSYIDLRCPNNSCIYHKKSLILMFQ